MKKVQIENAEPNVYAANSNPAYQNYRSIASCSKIIIYTNVPMLKTDRRKDAAIDGSEILVNPKIIHSEGISYIKRYKQATKETVDSISL